MVRPSLLIGLAGYILVAYHKPTFELTTRTILLVMSGVTTEAKRKEKSETIGKIL